MPELPEVSGLVGFLTERLVGRAVVGVELASFAVLKTFDPPPQAFEGLVVDAVHRHGKFVDIEASGLHFVFHLSRAGWLRWSDNLPTTTLRPGKSPIAVRVRLDDGRTLVRRRVYHPCRRTAPAAKAGAAAAR